MTRIRDLRRRLDRLDRELTDRERERIGMPTGNILAAMPPGWLETTGGPEIEQFVEDFRDYLTINEVDRLTEAAAVAASESGDA